MIIQNPLSVDEEPDEAQDDALHYTTPPTKKGGEEVISREVTAAEAQRLIDSGKSQINPRQSSRLCFVW